MLSLGFEKIPDVLSGNRPSALLARENRNRTGARSDSGQSFEPHGESDRRLRDPSFVPFVGKMFSNAQNVFVDIDSGPHDSRLAS